MLDLRPLFSLWIAKATIDIWTPLRTHIRRAQHRAPDCRPTSGPDIKGIAPG